MWLGPEVGREKLAAQQQSRTVPHPQVHDCRNKKSPLNTALKQSERHIEMSDSLEERLTAEANDAENRMRVAVDQEGPDNRAKPLRLNSGQKRLGTVFDRPCGSGHD